LWREKRERAMETQVYHCCDRNLVGLHALYHHFEQEHIHYDPRVKRISRYRAPCAQIAFDTFYAPRLFPHPAPFDLRRAPPDRFLAACERYGPIHDLIEPLQPLPDWFQSPARPLTMDDATRTVSAGALAERKVGSDRDQVALTGTTSSSDEPNTPTTPTDNNTGLSDVAGASKLES